MQPRVSKRLSETPVKKPPTKKNKKEDVTPQKEGKEKTATPQKKTTVQKKES